LEFAALQCRDTVEKQCAQALMNVGSLGLERPYRRNVRNDAIDPTRTCCERYSITSSATA
jgi:hypothetical protein